MNDLFSNEQQKKTTSPLADRMRPETLEDFYGQEDIIGEGAMLRQAIQADEVPSMILWGPPGSGKTTLARIVAKMTGASFVSFHAVTDGVTALRKVIAVAAERQALYGKRTILFIDEIHRWSKSQQDALLPFVENGTITLIGATTENPSFEVVSALLSRCRVYTLQKLSTDAIAAIVERALNNSENGLGDKDFRISSATLRHLAEVADGDARVALNSLEFSTQAAARQKRSDVTKDDIVGALQTAYLRYDKGGEEHYNIISALHKSMRGSDVSASIYWLGRMLEAGEDPLYVARRMVRFASEDVGLADPSALGVAVAGYQAAHFIGMPECNVILAEVAGYLAKAPKSNEVYSAYRRVTEDIREYGTLPVPIHLRNVPTKLMKDLGYGKNYQYTPEAKKRGEKIEQSFLPDELEGREYFEEE
ncbi:AAA family ATPase [Candidatus Uhrbacteria bacterium CG10_big_fil_rev_8_21_14_0_10_48_11]|uniref:Replication-associated recombination protein A n=1 Tax=Candidatus Uhrbacteria bacterium CG10_big_fil_rev_8_21_14_0_10_48_11 TaxID=1975037 RepID=A0A2M8LEJ9_9BACT|nr:MAG: AAA family ATPase [Candidatus Uhrbacteria bacterium CG10_big_fil_rev_8_21_14_0_10_48_11]